MKTLSPTNRDKAPKIIIHKKSAVRLSNGPFSRLTPYLALYIQTELLHKCYCWDTIKNKIVSFKHFGNGHMVLTLNKNGSH